MEVGPENTSQVSLSSPVLNEGELESLVKDSKLKAKVLPTFSDIRKGIEGSLEQTLNRLCEISDVAVRSGSELLVLSRRSGANAAFNSNTSSCSPASYSEWLTDVCIHTCGYCPVLQHPSLFMFNWIWGEVSYFPYISVFE